MMLDPVAAGFEIGFKDAMSGEDVTSRNDPSRFNLITIIKKCWCNLSIYTCDSDRKCMSIV